MITLYTAATPNCQKILIFLEEAGLNSEVCRVNAKNTFDNQREALGCRRSALPIPVTSVWTEVFAD